MVNKEILETYSLIAGIGLRHCDLLSICRAAGLGVIRRPARAPQWSGSRAALGIEPDFHPPQGGRKRGGGCRGAPSPAVFGPLTVVWVRVIWPLGSCLVDLSVSHHFPALC
jgi:hypothetical protein